MAIEEKELQEIVKGVMAKLQGETKPSAKKLGIFEDMNDAIAKAKEAQKIMQKMPMDFREKIITNIRRKTKENA